MARGTGCGAAGAGGRRYKIIDKSPFNGESYYRLTQYDINGVAERLGTQSIEFFPTKYLIYPVPVNKSMFLEGDNLMNSEILIINSLGEVIDVEQTIVGDKISFNFVYTAHQSILKFCVLNYCESLF